MRRPISLQLYVTDELATRVRKTAGANGMAVSEWLRAAVQRACDEDFSSSANRTTLARLHRQSLFAMVGIDALLAGHSDNTLRDRAHKAFAAKCKDAGLASGQIAGGSHVA